MFNRKRIHTVSALATLAGAMLFGCASADGSDPEPISEEGSSHPHGVAQ
jgi:hypothetical protein